MPVRDPAGRPIGVLDLQWSEPVPLAAWRETAELVADRLGGRIAALGGSPPSRSEKLLRHAAAFTAAPTDWDLMTAALAAARDVSRTLRRRAGPHRPERPTPRRAHRHPRRAGTRIRAELAEAGPAALDRVIDRAHRYGSAYTLGEAGHPPTEEYLPLTRAGARTLVAVPVGTAAAGGVLLVADEQRSATPTPTMST